MTMKNLHLYHVAPAIPEAVRFLETLARNLWWCWNADAIELFRRISPELWREANLNPLLFLRLVPQDRLQAMVTDDGFMRHLKQVQERFEESIARKDAPLAGAASGCICYFSLEYGIHESVRMYSGGLGVLAGDHLKSASDLKLPMVAVGLLYNKGYFRQRLDDKGWQQESYPDNLIHLLPLAEHGGSGNPSMMVSVPLPDGELKAVIWRLNVGCVPLYLLDTNIPENSPEYREITGKLYAGDRQMRLRQELLLGVGGHRALRALGYEPAVCHLNEGHAAFLSYARMSYLMKERGLRQDAAYEVVRRTSVFTTHTPVPAGNETFEEPLLRPHLDALGAELGLSTETMLNWTRPDIGGGSNYEPSMTVLGLRTAEYSNGVSELHGHVARRMWAHLWPGRPVDEVPIDHITNGVHVPSWVSPHHASLYEHYLGPTWRKHPDDPEMLARVDQIPRDELWQAHEVCRTRLIRAARECCERQLAARNATSRELATARGVLDQDVLTIGFARRFATYKRGVLLLRDPDRFHALLTHPDRPVQVIFGGKAHPADHYGKDFIRQIVDFAIKRNVTKRLLFIENYDISVARRLVQGADVWLNTPRRPHEASGTSGMKAALNGALNASILDGWWCEGHRINPDAGWTIGQGEEYGDDEYQDMVESQALYNLLENEIVPCFYDRASDDIPQHWTRMMKSSIRMALGFFTSHRMVRQYATKFYQPAAATYGSLMSDGASRSVHLADERRRLSEAWGDIGIDVPQTDRRVSMLHVGDRFEVTVHVRLGRLRPEDVDVQVYHGLVDTRNEIVESLTDSMTVAEDLGGGAYLYRCEVVCGATGRFGFTTRVTPRAHEWKTIMPGLMVWSA